MSDKDPFATRYRCLYRAMIEKDGTALSKLLDDSFILVHMTGMIQDKQQFIHAVESGTLNYFSEELKVSKTTVHKDCVQFIGKSIVDAAVFGGGRHTWRLQLEMKYVFVENEWLVQEAVASTW